MGQRGQRLSSSIQQRTERIRHIRLRKEGHTGVPPQRLQSVALVVRDDVLVDIEDILTIINEMVMNDVN
jgi:hypothetical protein